MALGWPCAHYENYPPDVWTVGDSTTTGVGAATLPAWRYGLFSASAPIRMVGSQSYGGTPDILGANASHEGHNGQTITTLTSGSIIGGTEIYKPDLVTFLFGINDIIAGADAATVLSRMSTAWDECWNRRTKSWMQLCPLYLLQNLNPAYEAIVVAVNAGMAALAAGKSYSANITVVTTTYSAAGGAGGMNDDTHPNDTGYARIGAALATALATPIQRARPIG